ncbi:MULTISPECIES: aminotransferase class I/II-fold pyridoxal phosphate-dependent enzyme [Streptomyces]|uniref:Ornithine decarboxylase n=1 Tax=Streptomyces griseocarneus TaxID=51201 RepID=A0ABX7RNE4_9ACTN|nr:MULTISPECIES: ornithine decarboxylase [Streptomyces]QSY49804.1 ornithine decarboxylase [Streptomyces griseocarneus]
MDHSRAPVLEALSAYTRTGQVPFTPPGHKQGRGTDPRVREVLGDAVFTHDLLAVGGLDDRTSSGRVLERAEALMADAVGAEHTFFSTCGSSLSVKAAMLAVAGPHEELLIGRDAHKSVVAGLILSGVRPVWVDPRWDAELHLAHPPSPADFEEAFERHPGARGALVTSPTPYGTCADLAALADVCHRRGKPLVVDEAWGAHLPFHPSLPAWAMDAGADVCVTSAHKMGSGLEQSSVFHLRGDRVDADRLRACADLLDTTSPSVLVHAALDGWRRQMVQHGRDLYDRALALADIVRTRLERIDRLHVHGREDFCGPGRAAALDPLQLVVDVSALGTTGYRAADWLRAQHRMTSHVSDHRRVSAQLTHADDEGTTGVLVEALRDLSGQASSLRTTLDVEVPPPADLRLEQAVLPRDAFFGPAETVPREKARGRISAETLTPYPPGIPAVLPGERFDAAVLRYLRTGVEAGMVVPDATDPGLDVVRVVAEE